MECAELIPINNDSLEIIPIDNNVFTLGRSISNSYIFKEPSISRNHCAFIFENGEWKLVDKSLNGMSINSQLVNKNGPQTVRENDIISFTDGLQFMFNIRRQIVPKKRRLMDNEAEKQQNLAQAVREFEDILNEKLKRDKPKNELSKENTNYNQRNVVNLMHCLAEEKARNEKLAEEIREIREKMNNLLTELQGKTENQVRLEQGHMMLEENCVKLEKDKEELQLQLQLIESELAESKQKFEDLKSSPTQVSLKSQADSDEEDKYLFKVALRAEIYDKECTISTKLATLSNEIANEGRNNLAYDVIDLFTGQISSIQKDITDLTIKRNELDYSLRSEAIKLTQKTQRPPSLKEDQAFDMLETELQCSICNELFIKATTLNCTHTFCKMCITQWKRQKNSCPICRIRITDQCTSIVIDNYIDKALENMTADKREARQSLKQTHDASLMIDEGQLLTSRINRSPERTIYVSSDSDTDIDSEMEFSDVSTDGYFGGYGSCFICGSINHWANGCPMRRRRY